MSTEAPDEEGERAGASDDEAQEGGSPIEQEAEADHKPGDDFKPWDDLHEAFGDAAEVRHVIGDDGLPTPIVDTHLTEAMSHPFTEDLFVCIADRREFVIRGKLRRVVAEIEAKHVELAPDGRYYAPVAVAIEALRQKGTLSKNQFENFERAADDRPTHLFRMLNELGAPDNAIVWREELVEVEPARPQCRHLLQQVEPLPPGTIGYKYGEVKKFCAVRRTLTGAFMNLTNESMKACSMRDPYDAPTGRMINDANDEKIEQSRSRTMLPLFNITRTEREQEKPQ